VKNESASKVKLFKNTESSLKKSEKEKSQKHPFNGLQAYCEKLQKMKKSFALTKEADAKKIEAMQAHNTAEFKHLTALNEKSSKKLVTHQCVQTREVCSKIHQTSERRQKMEADVASERTEKLKAKCALTTKYEKAEAKRMQFAICSAAHGELKKFLNTIQHQEGGVQDSVTAALQTGFVSAKKPW